VIAVGPELNDLVRGRQPEFFHAGICISHAVSCAAALVALSGDERPRAVIASSALPDMGLEEFVRVLRLVGVSAVMVDAAAVDSTMRRIAGEVRAIDLPLTPSRLSHALRSLPTPLPEVAPVVAAAGFELDQNSLTATWHGTLVRLQVRPFDLLRYLVQESPRVVSVQELASECVVASRDGGVSSVRMGIGRIRAALVDAGVNPSDVLQTVPGFGYRVAGAGELDQATPSSAPSDSTRSMI
jgi:DNA-binding response OmpR family regulator